MKALISILNPGTLQCGMTAATIFMVPFSKKSHFYIRYILVFLFATLCIPLMNVYQHWSVGAHPVFWNEASIGGLILAAVKTTINLLLYVAIFSVFWGGCCQISPIENIYCGSCVYLLQDFAYTLFVALVPEGAHRGGQPFQWKYLWIELLLLSICLLLAYLFLIRGLILRAGTAFRYKQGLCYMGVVLICGKILGTFARMAMNSETREMFRFLLYYDMLLTLSVLASQVLIYRESKFMKELEIETQLRTVQYQQFLSFQDTAAQIRHKCHDLKHMVSALQTSTGLSDHDTVIQDLKRSINHYDLAVNTGNSTLDALLSSVWDRCCQHQIQWTCYADGDLLSFIDTFDLYLMLGNALDNAIECVSAIDLKEKRFLSINIHKKQQLVFIRIENYCDHPVTLKNGLPVTSKKEQEDHGFGMKTIQSIAEKYNGVVSIHYEKEIFLLQIMLPIPMDAF